MERRRSPFVHAYKRPPAPHPVWTGGVQPQEEQQFGAVAAFGGTMVGLGALGFAPVGRKRIWDYYLRAIRAVEEISPARIFRTFQYSEMLSPLGSNRAFEFPAELFTYSYQKAGAEPIVAPNRAMRRFVSNMLGKPVAELEGMGVFSKGLEFRRTGWMFGEIGVKGGQVISKAGLPLKIGTHAGGSFVDWYARLTGLQLDITKSVARMSGPGMMAVSVPKLDKVLGIPISEIAAVHLQKARVVGRMARAYMAGQIGRLNRLLAAPADWFPALGKIMKRAGIRSLTIKPGSALQMLGRYTAKGLAIAGAYKGFQYLSYLRGQTDNRFAAGVGFAALGGALGGILRNTRRGAMIGAAIGAIVGTAPLFDRGVTEGVATGYTRAAMGYARASEAAGLTASRREQEEFMPGITKARTLLGFTTGGMMLGLLSGYGLKLAQFRRQGVEGATEFMKGQAKTIRARAKAIRQGRPGILGRGAAWLSEKTGAGAARGLRGRTLMRGGWIGAMLGAASFGALAIGAAWGTGNVLPGIVGAERTPEELERLYTGREDVPIRRGRWWEFGRSPWEGGRVGYYRPHWYHLLMSKAKIKGLHRSEKDKWDASPMLHPIKALFDEEFKYRWERENYYERPYPMTGTYGADVPFIAPITETLGRLIKPPRLMHTEEWLTGTGLEAAAEHGAVLHVPTAAEHEPAYELGGLKKGVPISRHQADQQVGEFIYRINELRGLTGFLHGAVKESLTGSQDYFDKMQQLETSTRATGPERAYWDKELGGLLGMTEAFRRFLPHRRRQIELYNPIRNLMPEWLPGCFVAGTLVWTEEGYVPIENLFTGDRVLSHTGKFNTVKHVQRRMYSGELVTISVQGVAQEITTTRDHPFLVVRSHKCPYYKTKTRYCIPGTHPNKNKPCKYCKEKQYSEPEWIQAGQIQRDDFVVCPSPRDRINGEREYIRVKEIPNRGRVKLATYNIPLTEEFGRVVGFYLSEGHASKYAIEFGSGKEEQGQRDALEWLGRLLDRKISHWNRFREDGTGCIVSVIHSRELCEWFKENFGHLSANKKLPSWIYDVPFGFIVGLVSAYIEGDGYITTRNGIGVTSDSISLIAGLSHLLSTYMVLNCSINSDGHTLDISNHDAYLLSIRCDAYGRKLSQIKNKGHGRSSGYYGANIVRRVTSVNKKDVQDIFVCNLEVNNDHTYNVYGVAVHNSEYYVDFHHGDPYTKVKEGEIRLPGRGYEALHPDVAGLAPEDYPLFHRFKILSDVAMYSDQFKKTRREMRGAIRRNELGQGQIEQFNRINQQVSERKKRKRFMEYRFTQDALEPKRIVVADVLPSGLIRTEDEGTIGLGGVEISDKKGTKTYRRKQAQVSDYLREYVQPGMELDIFVHRDPLHRFKKGPGGYYQPAVIEAGGRNLGEDLVDAEVMRFVGDEDPFAIRGKYNVAQRALGGLWEAITHYESPREYLLPLSPKAKFIHHRTAVEEYERTRLFGTEAAFWQHPIEHFIEPAAGMAAREWLGATEIPEDIQRRRGIEDYFDKLKWIKYKILERAAVQEEDIEATKEFRAQQRRTLFGVNPYGSLSYIYSAIPSLDRDYYEEFKAAQSPEERRTIMEMIAPNQRKLYAAQWRNQLATSLKARQSMDLIDGSAEAALESLNMARFAEGREVSPQLWKGYKEEAEKGESYADWSRRREAGDYFREKAPLPGPNWVGWHPHVDLEDVKLKIVDNLGEDMHDYNLWPSRKQQLARKPYITDEPLTAETRHPSELAKAIEGTLRSVLKLKNVQVHVLPAPAGQDEVQVDIADSRKYALQAYKEDSSFAGMM
jgi:hypothetical protein